MDYLLNYLVKLLLTDLLIAYFIVCLYLLVYFNKIVYIYFFFGFTGSQNITSHKR